MQNQEQSVKQEQSLNLFLNLEDVNIMLVSLGKLPYETVFKTVEKVRNQVVEQIQNKKISSNP
jgi:hypothetical protein